MSNQSRDAMQDWFERQRRERMAELQEMTSNLSDSPSAGASGSNTAAVRSLMERSFKSAAEDASSTPEATSGSGEQPQMPQAILVEVRGLFETRPVTNMLHSSSFRRDLENIVRASVNAARESQPRSLSSPAEPAVAAERPQVAAAPSPVRTPPQTPPQPSPRPRRSTAVVPPAAPPAPPIHIAAAQAPTENVQRRAEALLEELHREQLVVDISELLHTRLVSSTLNSHFRDRLENLIENRVNPEEGQRSLEAISQLPPSNRIRNDFTHMGIPMPAGGMDSDADSVSIISATAAAVPMSHTSVGMAREMAAMRSEMQEMRRMLRLVFDMQSDLHRAVRQEVSAALATASAPAPPTTLPSRPTQAAGRCLICLSARADTLAYRCGHLSMCHQCARSLGRHQSGRQTCPVCRAPVEDFVRVYVCDGDESGASA